MRSLVADTSVLIAVLREEPEWRVFIEMLERCQVSLSAAAFVECSIVLQRGPASEQAVLRLECLLVRLDAMIVPVNEAQARLAAAAFARYGKGLHPAGLNFGDCFSYALAKSLGQPLLYKGDDFSRTDIPSALAPWAYSDPSSRSRKA